jgi:6-phosphogluconolactonase
MPYAHATALDPSGRFLLVPDMGVDRVFIYRFDPALRVLRPAPTPFFQSEPGTGPRHIAFGRDGRFAYLVTELSAELRVLRWDAKGGG